MLNKIFTTLFLLTTVTSLLGQEKTTEKKKGCGCSFSSVNQIGLLAGETEKSFQIQTINGLRYRTWMVGAGVGIDGYLYPSIPLFLQIRKEFNLKSNVFFIYNDIGLNYAMISSDQKSFRGAGGYDPGVYYDGGIGYKVLIKKQALLFSGGFSLKEFKENRSGIACSFFRPCTDQVDVYSYSFNRLSFKVGIQF